MNKAKLEQLLSFLQYVEQTGIDLINQFDLEENKGKTEEDENTINYKVWSTKERAVYWQLEVQSALDENT